MLVLIGVLAVSFLLVCLWCFQGAAVEKLGTIKPKHENRADALFKPSARRT
jgi:hypothetical protein